MRAGRKVVELYDLVVTTRYNSYMFDQSFAVHQVPDRSTNGIRITYLQTRTN